MSNFIITCLIAFAYFGILCTFSETNLSFHDIIHENKYSNQDNRYDETKEDLISNELYVRDRSILQQEDSEALLELEGEITAMPPVFGMTKEEGDEYFPEFIYPECSTRSGEAEGTLNFDSVRKTMSFKCPVRKQGSEGILAILGPMDRPNFTFDGEHSLSQGGYKHLTTREGQFGFTHTW